MTFVAIQRIRATDGFRPAGMSCCKTGQRTLKPPPRSMALSVEQAGLGYPVMSVTLAQLRRHAIARSLFHCTTPSVRSTSSASCRPIRFKAPARPRT